MTALTRVWTTGCRRRYILPANIESIPSAWEEALLDLILYDRFKIQGLPAGNAAEIIRGILAPGHHRVEKRVRCRGPLSTLGGILGRPEDSSAKATGGTLIWGWDKPRPRSKLQRYKKSLEKRPIRQNTLNFSFRGLDNGVNYTWPSMHSATTRSQSMFRRTLRTS